MNQLIWLLKWMLRAAIFFALFAFALNNQQAVTVNFFFGRDWNAPLVLVVLSAFAIGLTAGVLGMLPGWLRRRQIATPAPRSAAHTPSALTPLPPHES